MSGTFVMMMAAGARRVLPYKRRLAYLESTGTQYIDTGVYFNPAQNMQATVRAAAINTARSIILSSYSGVSNVPAFGLEWGGVANSHALTPRAYIQLPTVLDLWDGAQTLYDPVDIDVLYQYASDVKSVTMSVGGVEYAMSGTAELGGQSNYSILLFSDYRPNPSAIANGNRIYSVALKKNGALVCDMIPVLDWNDVPCMYDKVSGQLFYNQGTGQFVVPPGELPVDGQYGVWLKSGTSVISSAMTMMNAVFSSYHDLSVYASGKAIGTLISGGAAANTLERVFAGGLASDTHIVGGHLEVHSGGRAVGGNIENEMYALVYSGGQLSGFTVNRGYIDVNNQGFCADVVLSRVAGGSGRFYVKSGGTASGVVVNSGARLGVSSGGTALAVTSNAGAAVTSAAGAYIEYVTP